MYLGIDIGTSSVKAVLIDSDQRILASASEPLEVQRPHPGWSEQDPESWVAATPPRSTRSPGTHPEEIKRVRGIGLSGQMHGATLLDKAEARCGPHAVERWAFGRGGRRTRRRPSFREITGNIVFPGFTAPNRGCSSTSRSSSATSAACCSPRTMCGCGSAATAPPTCRTRLERRGSMSPSATGRRSFSRRPPASRPDAEAARRDRDHRKTPPGAGEPRGMAEAPVIAGGGGDNAASACGVGTVCPARPSCRSAHRVCSSSPMTHSARMRRVQCTPSATLCRAPGTRWV